MNQAKKKIVWQQYIGTAFSMLIGAICGYAMVMFIDSFSDDTLSSRNRLRKRFAVDSLVF